MAFYISAVHNLNIVRCGHCHEMSAAVSEPPPPPLLEAPAAPTQPPDMNADGEGATPLMYACQQAREADLKAIMAKKPGAVRERDRTLKSALHYCAENSSLGCAEAVLRTAPELLDARDEDGYTTLHLAVIAGNSPLLRLLLARGADVNCVDNERHSVVHWATVCGEVEALETVLGAGASASCADMHGGYPLHYAAQMCGPSGDRGGSRLGLAVLRTLLAHGVEVNVTDQDGRQPMLWAASAGSADAILGLVNAGASVEADDKDGLTALHCAASRGHTDCLETLISLCGAAVDVMDTNGCTALFYAVTLGHADATQLLLEHGAQPNRQDRKGRTPAHCGAAKGQLETLRLLSSRGANMWARNVKGDYPLHEAVSSGRKDLVRWLLAQRPDAVNASNNDGRCPLHIAAINNNVEICKIVLDHESLVNPVMRTSKGVLMTPLDAALYKGNRGCAKYLQLHGGVPATKLTSQSAALRGVSNRGEPLSDQLTTPDWGPHLTVPVLRGAQSLVHSPVDLASHKHLTVVDATSTLEVRVEDELLHRRGSESSIDDKVRRRRRKRRPKREGSEVETDSSGRQARRRRRRMKDHEDTSDEESEVESRRRRRRSRKGRGSEESESEDTSKRKKKESKYRRKRSVSSDRGKEVAKKDKVQEEDSYKSNEETKSNEDEDNLTDGKTQLKENRRVLKEEITTKEVTKSKKVVEHKEKEKLSTNPTVTKTSKTTHEETKTEEQITTKTSKIISTPPDSKGDDASTQDSQDIPTQQVVTAIVHQEESAEQTICNVQNGISENSQETAENPQEDGEPSSELKNNENDATVVNEENGKDETTLEEDVKVDGPEESQDIEKEKENNTGDKTPDITDFFQENDSGTTPSSEKAVAEETQENDLGLPGQDADNTKKNEKEEGNEEENAEDTLEEDHTSEINAEPSQEIENNSKYNNGSENSELIQKTQTAEVQQEMEPDVNTEDEKLNKLLAENDTTDVGDKKDSDENQETGVASDNILESAERDQNIMVENEPEQNYDTNENILETDPIEEDGTSTQEKNIKGLMKVMGRTEVDDEHLKGVVKVEKISSDALRERGKVKERVRGRRRPSSFEIVSPARSLPDEDLDSETPRSRSRTGADSSQLHDSGFEPSPRRDSKKSSRIPRACRRSLSHSRMEADSDDDRPSLSTVSVTQAVQHSMRKYHLERRIFHELLELKRLQIRAGRANEAVLVKRLVDDYRRAGLSVGLKPYEGVFTFRAFEKYLYDQLRLLQSSDRRIIPRLKSTDDLEKLTRALRRTRAGNTLLDNVPENPIFCTHGTHRCYHATHAYTGVPCAAYIAKLNHHTMPKASGQPSFLPRIDSGQARVEGQGAEIARCLRYVDPSRPVTLELSHGADRQVISLPTEKLDKNKRYYVTFTIKGGDGKSADKERHQHAKSF